MHYSAYISVAKVHFSAHITKHFPALQILSVDSPHKSASQISSCNGTRRTAGHVHPEVRI